MVLAWMWEWLDTVYFVNGNKGIYHIPIHSIWRLSITLFIFVFGVDVSAIPCGFSTLTTAPWNHLVPSSGPCFQMTSQIWASNCGGNGMMTDPCPRVSLFVGEVLWPPSLFQGEPLSSFSTSSSDAAATPWTLLRWSCWHGHWNVGAYGGDMFLDARGPSPITAMLQRVLGASSCFNGRVFCLESRVYNPTMCTCIHCTHVSLLC